MKEVIIMEKEYLDLCKLIAQDLKNDDMDLDDYAKETIKSIKNNGPMGSDEKLIENHFFVSGKTFCYENFASDIAQFL